MPTVALGNSIVFTHANVLALPKIRVWGTIGWIVAGLVVGFLGWTSDLNMFYLAGGASLVLGVYSFTLPNTPPPAKGDPVDIRALFMVDAFSLFIKRPAFLIFHDMLMFGLYSTGILLWIRQVITYKYWVHSGSFNNDDWSNV